MYAVTERGVVGLQADSWLINYMLTRLKLMTAFAIGWQEWCYPYQL